ncbi:sigma factor-like helix-turn-helix DNA-binding protein [Streptomyces sp. L2]|uniref:sigma factor-like helix-turn-helix DNA-binding protein n=1 Tax=Streptomyces sp. L2 TaxID=2162665 RepID=UPI001F50B65E|nr:sigma factor-like helix-turn-helix DNA-binding protein [Streptomyces sp. L2]
MADDRTDAGADTATRVFLDHRELLFAIAYNMLGTVTDSEDVLQETWLSWAGRTARAEVRGGGAGGAGAEGAGAPADPADGEGAVTGGGAVAGAGGTGGEGPAAGAGLPAGAGGGRAAGAAPVIEHPRAYLVRIAVRHALARRESIARRRETYVGPWLPEPLVTGGTAGDPDAADEAVRQESVSLALLVVLETLTPLERAVFVLHEVFGYAHTEIADMLGRSPAAVRQLAHRARGHVRARRPRYRAHPRVRRQVTERFLDATIGGDLGALMEILAPDATLWTDGGGKAPAAPRPIRGRDKVARALTGFAARSAEGLELRHRDVNGDASVVVFADGAPHAVMVMDLDPDREQVRDVYLVTNPDKLSTAGGRAEERAPGRPARGV